MGQTTPNISLYIPSAGETNFAQAFAAGMINLDRHDHTGGPTNGVQITTSGLADFSVTYQKLAPNVADATTGVQAGAGTNKNQIQIIGLLQNIFKIAFGTNGFLSKNGIAADAHVFTGTTNQVVVANGNGSAAGPTNISLAPIVIRTTQPAFCVGINTQTLIANDAAPHRVKFDAPLADQFFDQAGDFGMFTFTVPTTGIYSLFTTLQIGSINSAGDVTVDFSINTGAQVYVLSLMNPQPIKSSTSDFAISGSEILKLTVGDIVNVRVTNATSTANLNVFAGSFGAALLF